MADAVSASGALLVALVFAAYLTSSAVHFAVSYLRLTGDPWQWQVAVLFLTALATADTGILAHSAYEHLVENFGNQDNLSSTGWDLTAHLAILVTLATVAQVFYAFKLSTLYSGKRRAGLVGAVVLLACAQLAFGIAATYSSFHDTASLFTVDLEDKFGWQLLASSLAAFLANFVIAVAMIKDMRSARFAAREETVVEVFTRYVLETNVATAIVSILAFAFYLAWNAQGQESGVFLGLSMILPKLYLLSMLASLERGAEVAQGGLSRNMKHASSLSDMFKGVPLGRGRGLVTASRIGTPTTVHPTPIADRFAAGGGAATPEQPGWLRRTFQPSPATIDSSTPLAPLAPPSHSFGGAPPIMRGSLAAPHTDRPVTAMSVSDYGAWLDDGSDEASAAGASLGGGRDPFASGAGVVYAGSQAGAEGAFASGVEQAQTPTPRRATFALAQAAEAAGGGEAAGAEAARTAQARGPVRYGYL
ncbi:hypothetical protein JCM10450v2_008045 [Rhodotorula kratochvilovae]